MRAFVRERGVGGRIYDVTAITSCVGCRGVVVVSLTDSDRRLIPYSEMVGWFYELNAFDRRCVGNEKHVESGGWGYYWNLDRILEVSHPDGYARDMRHRDGKQHFGVPVLGVKAKVHVVRICGPFHVEPVRFTKPEVAAYARTSKQEIISS